ncbi:MAG TPA: hypothetical protein VGP70_15080 [Actinomadura sp.]|jgi:hypothetical protein|nr:hypothetical protein [Actinomadura sp.]
MTSTEPSPAARLSPWAGTAALAPYVAMKTSWAWGGTAGKPAGDFAEEHE